MVKIRTVLSFSKLLSLCLLIPVCLTLALSQSKTNRLFPVYENGKAGFIDNTGKLVIPLKFEYASDFSEGLALIKIDNKSGFINQSGKTVFFLPPIVDEAGEFADGLAAVEIGKKWGYIDTSGKVVIQPVYDQVHQFEDGLAHVSLRIDSVLKDAYIDTKGNIVIGFQSFNYLFFSDGAAFDSNQQSFIDRKGNIAISRDYYTSGGEFSEGLAAVEISDKWGFINKNGDLIITPQFDWAGEFSEGLAPVRFDKWNVKVPLGEFKGIEVVTSAYGYIDNTGRIIIEPQFRTHSSPYDDEFAIGNFSEGLVKMEDVASHKWGYINRVGKVVIEPQFDEAEDFMDGVAFVEIDDKRAYINKSGKYIWKAKD
jgi:hypothetical protein